MAPIDSSWTLELPRPPERQLWSSDEWQGRYYELLQRTARNDEGLQRAAYWMCRLAEEIGGRQDLLDATPGVVDVRVGFLDPELDSMPPTTAGVIVEAESGEVGLSVQVGEVFAPEGATFPIVVRNVGFVPDEAIADPIGGLAACWVRSRCHSPAPNAGWLTAAHVVPVGEVVTYGSGATGQLIDRAAACIDGAVVSTSDRPPQPPRARVTPCLFGQRVAFRDRSGTVHESTVTDVSTTFGMLTSKYFPRRFAIDNWGHPGDSGALVLAHEEIVGIYLGHYRAQDPQFPNPLGGVCLAADQLERIMDMEFFYG